MDNKTASEWLESIKDYIHGGDEKFDMRRLEAIDAGIQALKAREPGWISVKDRMPGNNEDVLIYGEWKGASGTKYRELSLSDMEDYINQGYTPIAWIPLPELPKEE